MGLTDILRQGSTICRISLTGIRRRVWSSVNALMGTAAVVGVLVALLSIAEGYRRTLNMTGSEENAMILRSGSKSELESFLSVQDANLVRQSDLVATTADGTPLVAAEVYVVTTMPDRKTRAPMNVAARGVEATSFEVREGIQLTEGRRFALGRREVIVGKKASERFEGLALGDSVRLADGAWTVVGIFAADEALSESEIWMDVAVLQSSLQRLDTVQVITARMADGVTVNQLSDALDDDPRLSLNVESEAAYYAEQSDQMDGFVGTLAYAIVFLMGLGAVFAALNTGQAAVAARTREISVLAALGFDDRAIMVSVVAESLVLSLLGAVLGAGMAYLLFDGHVGSTVFFSRDFSQVVFSFAVSGSSLVQATIGALAIGLVAGVVPAMRLGRSSYAAALGGRP